MLIDGVKTMQYNLYNLKSAKGKVVLVMSIIPIINRSILSTFQIWVFRGLLNIYSHSSSLSRLKGQHRLINNKKWA
jgi:hypothetical protein